MMKILIVDDSKLIRAQVKNVLKAENYEIIGEAGSGKDAAKKYKDLKPDLVIMDVIMPNGNGIEATKMIMAMDEGAKVLLMSTDNQVWRVTEAVIAGGKGYIRKPFTDAGLLEKVKEMFAEGIDDTTN